MILISSGEPSGIGPDIILKLTQHHLHQSWVVLGDIDLFESRAKMLNLPVKIKEYIPGNTFKNQLHELWIWHVPLKKTCHPGILNTDNAAYVLELLNTGTHACMTGLFNALVTAPVHKGVIADAGFEFSGHTEYFAELTATPEVVMMLVSCQDNNVQLKNVATRMEEASRPGMAASETEHYYPDNLLASKPLRIALVTTHLPLREVPNAITQEKLIRVINIIHHDFKKYFGFDKPQIYVCGLNPHAGENGHLGREEIEIIAPTLKKLKEQGIHVEGPFPADSLFTKTYLNKADVFLAMYHDQGLSVLKYAAFDEGVNITLGLPFIRTSVDHGTALDLAGTGKVSENSLIKAIEVATQMAAQIKTQKVKHETHS